MSTTVTGMSAGFLDVADRGSDVPEPILWTGIRQQVGTVGGVE